MYPRTISLHLFLRPTTPKMALEGRPFGGMREQDQVESTCSAEWKGCAVIYTHIASGERGDTCWRQHVDMNFSSCLGVATRNQFRSETRGGPYCKSGLR